MQETFCLGLVVDPSKVKIELRRAIFGLNFQGESLSLQHKQEVTERPLTFIYIYCHTTTESYLVQFFFKNSACGALLYVICSRVSPGSAFYRVPFA